MFETKEVVAYLGTQETGLVWTSYRYPGRSVSKDALIEGLEKETQVGKDFLESMEIYAKKFGLEGDVGKIVDAVIEHDIPSLLGRRFVCTICKMELMVAKAAPTRGSCCGKLLEVMPKRPLPSSD